METKGLLRLLFSSGALYSQWLALITFTSAHSMYTTNYTPTVVTKVERDPLLLFVPTGNLQMFLILVVL